MALQPVAATREQKTGVGNNMRGRPGTAPDQQARIVGMDMQQFALFGAGLYRFDDVLAFG